MAAEVAMHHLDLAERPAPDEYAQPYAGYVGAVPEGDILVTLEREGERALAFLRAVPHGLIDRSYAPGKWTVRQVVAHVNDAERVFAYRALTFGRGDGSPLPGFDQEMWMPRSRASVRAWEDLLDEFRVVRAATLHLLRSFDAEAWRAVGIASGYPVGVRALAWIAAGHELHHRRVLAERYGLGGPGA
jgi:hypothetical protein